MGARGRRGLIVGLNDLAKGVMLATEMKRQAAADILEREKFEASKAEAAERSRVLDEYYQGLLTSKRSELSAKAREAAEKQRAKLSESIQRGRVSKNLESGNLTRAARIAFNRGLALPEHLMSAFKPADQQRETELEFFKRDPAGYSRYRSAGREPDRTPSDVYGEVRDLSARIAQDRGAGLPASPSFIPEATRFVRGADNLPFPKTPEEEDDEMTAEEIVARGYEKELLEAKNTVVELIRLAGVPNGRLNAEGQRVVKLLATAEGQLAKEQVLRDFLGVNPKNPGKFNERKVLRLLEGY